MIMHIWASWSRSYVTVRDSRPQRSTDASLSTCELNVGKRVWEASFAASQSDAAHASLAMRHCDAAWASLATVFKYADEGSE